MEMLIVLLIGAVALCLIIRDIARPAKGSSPQRRGRWLRAAPFVICATLSLWAAARAPKGRKPFAVDFSLVPEDLARSMTKVPHLVGVAVLVLIAILAFGTRRLVWAFVATMLLGIGWEICEATVVGHYARLADLAPNLAAGLVTIAAVAAIRWFIDRRQSTLFLRSRRRGSLMSARPRESTANALLPTRRRGAGSHRNGCVPIRLARFSRPGVLRPG